MTKESVKLRVWKEAIEIRMMALFQNSPQRNEEDRQQSGRIIGNSVFLRNMLLDHHRQAQLNQMVLSPADVRTVVNGSRRAQLHLIMKCMLSHQKKWSQCYSNISQNWQMQDASKVTRKSSCYSAICVSFHLVLRFLQLLLVVLILRHVNSIYESLFKKTGKMDVYINNEMIWRGETLFHPCSLRSKPPLMLLFMYHFLVTLALRSLSLYIHYLWSRHFYVHCHRK